LRSLVAASLVTLLAPVSAHAYLDPASGSILLQVVLGGVAGCAVFLKLFWGRLRGLFGSRKPAEPHDDHPAV
jgi:hypothetical protein